MKLTLLALLLFFSMNCFPQEIALLKYSGGGDWYANPTALPNLIKFCNQSIGTRLKQKPATVELSNPDLLSYPFVHATGHGNIVFSDAEAQNLRAFLLGGGFIHFDDNYGMDQYIRKEFKKVFPDKELVELPSSHPIFQKPYSFPNGLPKIHEHEGKRPQAFGIIVDGRLALLYTFECDLGDGWEDPEVHNDPREVREKALKMGANILNYAFTN